ncbi:hypothetical protein DFS34DRAFT_624321 [Phlyctochytrium arcticum]|nr:hypothetical protein DFS34DRAFT_624321 [Phlyctochytrium arcticum]
MFAKICLLLGCLIQMSLACGCYGPASCSLQGRRCQANGFVYLSQDRDPCVCDCCNVCNSCEQLLNGCVTLRQDEITLSPSLTPFRFNHSIPRTILLSTTERRLGLFGDVCLRGHLPPGIEIEYRQPLQTFMLSGTPNQTGIYKVSFIAWGGGSRIFEHQTIFEVLP